MTLARDSCRSDPFLPPAYAGGGFFFGGGFGRKIFFPFFHGFWIPQTGPVAFHRPAPLHTGQRFLTSGAVTSEFFFTHCCLSTGGAARGSFDRHFQRFALGARRRQFGPERGTSASSPSHEWLPNA